MQHLTFPTNSSAPHVWDTTFPSPFAGQITLPYRRIQCRAHRPCTNWRFCCFRGSAVKDVSLAIHMLIWRFKNSSRCRQPNRDGEHVKLLEQNASRSPGDIPPPNRSRVFGKIMGSWNRRKCIPGTFRTTSAVLKGNG